MRKTKTFDRIIENLENDDARTIILQGSTSSSKTHSTLQVIHGILSNAQRPLLASVVAETMPAVRKGAMRDYFNIIAPAYNAKDHNKSDSIYKVGKSQIEFFGADNSDRCQGPRRDILFLNEAINIRKAVRDQLEVRTKMLEFIDFNPRHEFWAHRLVGTPGVYFFISTYKDNQFLEPAIVRSIESRKEIDPEWWRVYGLGEIGSVEGLVFPRFEQIDKMPEMSTTLGLDFGFSNDPTGLVETGISGDSMYIRELLYERGLLIPELMAKLTKIGVRKNEIIAGRHVAGDRIIADASRPEIIAEMARHRWNIKKYDSVKHAKLKGSIAIGIEFIRRYKLKVTKSSTNWINEARNYRYQENKNNMSDKDKYLSEPIDAYNHLMDPTRYSNNDRMRQPQIATSRKQVF